jgi:hypothetical protein
VQKDLVAAPGEDGRVRHVKKVGEELVERKVLGMFTTDGVCVSRHLHAVAGTG